MDNKYPNVDKSLPMLSEEGQREYQTNVNNLIYNLREAAKGVANMGENWGRNLSDMVSKTVNFSNDVNQAYNKAYDYDEQRRWDAANQGTLWYGSNSDENGKYVETPADRGTIYPVESYMYSRRMYNNRGGLNSFLDLYDILPTKEEKLQAIRDAARTFDAHTDEPMNMWFEYLYDYTNDPTSYYGTDVDLSQKNPYLDISDTMRDFINKNTVMYDPRRI